MGHGNRVAELHARLAPLPFAHATRSATTAVSQPSLLILVEIWNLYICFELDKILFVVCRFFAPCFYIFLFPNMVCMPIFGKSSFSKKFGKFFLKTFEIFYEKCLFAMWKTSVYFVIICVVKVASVSSS